MRICMAYDIIIPSIPVIAGYLLTYCMYNMNLIKRRFHVNLWNLILFLSFLISGLAGFILLILLDLGVSVQLNAQLLYWHAEFGVTLVVVTIFHLKNYWKSFRSIIFKNKRRVET